MVWRRVAKRVVRRSEKMVAFRSERMEELQPVRLVPHLVARTFLLMARLIVRTARGNRFRLVMRRREPEVAMLVVKPIPEKGRSGRRNRSIRDRVRTRDRVGRNSADRSRVVRTPAVGLIRLSQRSAAAKSVRVKVRGVRTRLVRMLPAREMAKFRSARAKLQRLREPLSEATARS